MRKLYPPIKPYNQGMLPVSSLHTIHYEQVGNPDGKPVLFLHGGPGGGIDPTYRQFFNPKRWRVILVDQRGCGKSTPYAELAENTTWDLVEDCEKLRKHLGIAKWAVFGGSWGSTLSIAYAETHPKVVTALFLRGIFLFRWKELLWYYQDGASRIFPDAWEKFLAPIPKKERSDLITAYHKRLTSKNKKQRLEAARAWSIWEGGTSKLFPDKDLMRRFGKDTFAEAFARIECHYFINKGFLKDEQQLLRDVKKIRHIPGIIVQGRYDVVCPIESAWELHRAWPKSKLIIVPDAGHSVSEKGTTSALIEATDKFAKSWK